VTGSPQVIWTVSDPDPLACNTIPNPQYCGTKPSPPTGLAASGTTSGATTLNWNATAPPTNCTISSYTVLQNGTSIGSTTSTSFAVTGLSPSTTYTFTVEASDSAGTSGPSAAVTVTTQSEPGGSSGNGCCGGSVICGGEGIQSGAGNISVCDPSTCECEFASPIIIDTTGHGFHLTSLQNGVKFDILNSGIPIKIAWTAADSGNAFLALDRNHNGRIDNGGELFGNHTLQPSSADPNGFLALGSSTNQKMEATETASLTRVTPYIRSCCCGSTRTTTAYPSPTNCTPSQS
jgi:chitodextrinase